MALNRANNVVVNWKCIIDVKIINGWSQCWKFFMFFTKYIRTCINLLIAKWWIRTSHLLFTFGLNTINIVYLKYKLIILIILESIIKYILIFYFINVSIVYCSSSTAVHSFLFMFFTYNLCTVRSRQQWSQLMIIIRSLIRFRLPIFHIIFHHNNCTAQVACGLFWFWLNNQKLSKVNMDSRSIG